jgi:isopropylmalate/homocitrate/citramalate synthase
MTDRLIIFDTTLRDGQQAPGASMTLDDKVRIATQLERMKVDVIEAGFAASSNGDYAAIRQKQLLTVMSRDLVGDHPMWRSSCRVREDVSVQKGTS